MVDVGPDSTDAFKSWIGRTEVTTDVVTAAPLAGLAALLDLDEPPGPAGQVPPLGHWLCFLPRTRQSQLGADGHPARGGFLPPVSLPRRMWAGGRLQFEHPIAVGATLERHSRIADVSGKSGKSGAMVFVTVEHEIFVSGRRALREEQDIVYRDASQPAAGGASNTGNAAAATASEWTRQVQPDPTQLFRFSALTFNAHRIHYDRDYACRVEGYGGLVVHGPLTAMLLVQHYLNRYPQTSISQFSFRAHRPLFDTTPFQLCMAAENGFHRLWTLDSNQQVTMTASLR